MRPRALVDLATNRLIAWGFCDFTPRIVPGQVEQFEDANEQLPDEAEFCYWDGQRTQVVDAVKRAEIEQKRAKLVPNLIGLTEQAATAKANLDEYLALTDAELTASKIREIVRFQLRVLERIVRYLV